MRRRHQQQRKSRGRQRPRQERPRDAQGEPGQEAPPLPQPAAPPPARPPPQTAPQERPLEALKEERPRRSISGRSEDVAKVLRETHPLDLAALVDEQLEGSGVVLTPQEQRYKTMLERWETDLYPTMSDRNRRLVQDIRRMGAMEASAAMSAVDKNARCVQFRREGRYADAIAMGLEAHRAMTRMFGSGHPHTTLVQYDLALNYEAIGDLEEALVRLNNCITIWRATQGDTTLDVARAQGSAGNLYARLGRLSEAEACMRESLRARRELLGEVHYEVAEVYNNLGMAVDRKGEHQEARRLYEQCLSVAEQCRRDEGFNVSYLLHVARFNLGNTLNLLGESDQALVVLNECLGARLAEQGPRHPDVGAAYSLLGVVLGNLGRYDEALGAHFAALSIRESALGQENQDVATSWEHIAVSYLYKGSADCAKLGIPFARKALRLRKKGFGAASTKVGHLMGHLGTMYGKVGRYLDSMACFGTSLPVLESLLGESHPSYALVMYDLGTLLRRLGRYRDALRMFAKAHAIYYRAMGPGNPLTQEMAMAVQEEIPRARAA